MSASREEHIEKAAPVDINEVAARYEGVFEAMAEGFLLAEVQLGDADRAADIRFIDANPAAIRMLGSDVRGRLLSEVNRAFEPHWYETFGRVARTGRGERVELYAAPLGALFNLNAFRVGAPENRHVAVVFSDVTEARRLESVLRRSETRNRLALAVAQIGTWSYNPDTDLIALDRRTREMLGSPADDNRISLEDLLARVHPDDRARVSKALDRALSADSQGVYDLSFRIVWDDGSHHWLSMNGQAGFDREAATIRGTRFIGTAFDITPLKQTEAALTEANRAKDEFLAMLGHELRNPLAPIVTLLDLMRIREPDVLLRERTMIERHVRHLVALVDDLLDVSRITSGKLELNKTPMDIGEIVETAVAMTKPLLERHEQTLQVNVEEGLVVNADHRRLVQVVNNLLSNAAKYSPARRMIHVRAEAEQSHGDEYVMLRVRDQGYGIDAELLPRIFDSFTQSNQTLERSEGGLGLGLALVKNLTALHDGDVTAQSGGRGQGSEFAVSLPLFARHAPERVRPPAPAPVKKPEAVKQRRILIVDDYVHAAESLAMVLESAGHEARVAHDGPAALEAAVEFKPEVALVDIGLPVMDGYELAGRLRRIPVCASIPMIALTGYGQASDKVRAEQAGFDAHIVKPAQPERIETVIAEIVRDA